MKLFFYDTETSDMPDWSQPSSGDKQPHIAQIAACLVDRDSRRVISEVDLLIRPDGWACTPETIAIHGISHERACDEGIDEKAALSIVHELWKASDCRVGHAEPFDMRVVRIGLKRFGFGDAVADAWKAGVAECTGVMSKLAMKHKGRGLPKLTDAYRHFTGEDLVDAHTARADMHACMRVFWAIRSGRRG